MFRKNPFCPATRERLSFLTPECTHTDTTGANTPHTHSSEPAPTHSTCCGTSCKHCLSRRHPWAPEQVAARRKHRTHAEQGGMGAGRYTAAWDIMLCTRSLLLCPVIAQGQAECCPAASLLHCVQGTAGFLWVCRVTVTAVGWAGQLGQV